MQNAARQDKYYFGLDHWVEPHDYEANKLFAFYSYLLAMGEKSFFTIHKGVPYNVPTVDRTFDLELGRPLAEMEMLFGHAPENLNPEFSVNLLKNGSFEQEDQDWNEFVRNGSIDFDIDPTQALSGGSSLRAEVKSGGSSGGKYQNVNLKPNTVYTLSSWIKNQNLVGTPRMFVQTIDSVVDNQTSITHHLSRGNDWAQNFNVLKTGPSPDTNVVYGAHIAGGESGRVWFDDIRLVEGIPIFTRAFERGVVFVNPTEHTAKVTFTTTLGSPTGQAINQITLGPKEGTHLFVLGFEPPPQPDPEILDHLPKIGKFLNPFYPREEDLVIPLNLQPDETVTAANVYVPVTWQKVREIQVDSFNRLIWNGMNKEGYHVVPGTYYVQIKTSTGFSRMFGVSVSPRPLIR